MNPGADDSWLARRRNLILAGALVVAVIATSLVAGRSGSHDEGATRPQVSFGAHIQPPAGSNGSLPFNNGWIASGATSSHAVAVYAASQPSNRQNGLFVIQRETGNRLQPWKTRTILIHGSGALTLLRPAQPATESQAFDATLHFVTGSGATGTLDLSTDKVSLSR